jgi:hypothetical protein
MPVTFGNGNACSAARDDNDVGMLRSDDGPPVQIYDFE